MTRFLPLSDLHLEFLPGVLDYLPTQHKDDADTVLLLAGDIHVGTGAVDWIEHIAGRYKAVCYILGNHEFYHQSYEDLPVELAERFDALCLDNVFFLRNDSVTLGETRVIGTTLWSDFNGADDGSMAVANRQMSDFRLIQTRYGLLDPSDIVDEFEENVAFLDAELRKPHAGATVVMTHHLPSFDFIGKEFRHLSDLNGAFASDLSDIYTRHDIDLWVFGHSHQALMQRVGNCLFVSNARGYPDEPTPGFDDSMRIDLLGE